MRISRLIRVLLWIALAITANANRRHFHLPTAWLPHGLGNTLILWLPEIMAPWQAQMAQTARNGSTVGAIGVALNDVVTSPNYPLAIAPNVLGYVCSHPRFNIYHGDWGEMKLLGFGLDAIPHSSTAFGLTLLARQGIVALARRLMPDTPLYPLVSWAAAHPNVTSGTVVALLSLAWEWSEYRIQQIELRARDYDYSKINMKWDLEDTIHDLMANGMGWGVATIIASSHAPESPQ